MSYAAVLMSSPAAIVLDDALLRRAQGALPRADAPRWLSTGTAAEVSFASGMASTDVPLMALTASLRSIVAGLPIDVAIVPLADRRKRLLLADMDSTMIEQECIDELAAFVGLKDEVSAITARAMRGEIAFEPALRERVALLKGLPETVVDEIVRSRLTFMPGGRALIATMRANGAYTALVSGGFTVFTSRIGRMLGFHEDRSNVLDIVDGRLAGTVRDPILGKEAKRASLIELRERAGLSPAHTMAVGDGANDLDMLGEAGLGVALHAKPAVAAAAHVRIDHADLTALLYLQGYAKADFAA
jgi:phosphoserine phosphatase